ncbi:MAG: lysophospholipid acyltransferase family protein [Deltaproteobacteria bacterium]
MVRFVLLNAFLVIYSILFCLWGIAISIRDPKGRRVHAYCAVPWSKSILWVCGIKVRVLGLENLETEVPRIYMVNHQSYFDIFALLAHLPLQFKFVLKQELMRIPFLGSAMRRARYVGIDRDDPRKSIRSMNEAADRFREGASILIFPEGTRSPDGQLQAFKAGGFHLALKARGDIVPVSIVGTHRIVPKGSLRIQKGEATMVIGKPIPIRDYSKKTMDALMNRVHEAMARQMQGVH